MVNPKHFKVAPEALQFNLDRSNYLLSVINFMRSYAAVVMGWETSMKKLILPTTF